MFVPLVTINIPEGKELEQKQRVFKYVGPRVVQIHTINFKDVYTDGSPIKGDLTYESEDVAVQDAKNTSASSSSHTENSASERGDSEPVLPVRDTVSEDSSENSEVQTSVPESSGGADSKRSRKSGRKKDNVVPDNTSEQVDGE